MLLAPSRSCSLTHLCLASCGGVRGGDDLCAALSQHCAGLASLDLWRCATLTARGVAELAGGAGAQAIRELDLGWCAGVDATTGCIDRLAQRCNNMERWGGFKISPINIET